MALATGRDPHWQLVAPFQSPFPIEVPQWAIPNKNLKDAMYFLVQDRHTHTHLDMCVDICGHISAVPTSPHNIVKYGLPAQPAPRPSPAQNSQPSQRQPSPSPYLTPTPTGGEGNTNRGRERHLPTPTMWVWGRPRTPTQRGVG